MKQRFLRGLGKAFPMLFFMLLCTAAYAQKTVTGRVTSTSSNQPVIGATVTVKGTPTATTTNNDGVFSINVPAGRNVLVISYVGFAEQEVDISSTNSVNVSLLEAAGSLGEVVVTGYTTQRKKDIIGAVTVVSSKDLNVTPASNLAAQLQGRAAGVVVSSSGEPGAAAVVRIRGFASYGNNAPLYIVDGVPTTDPSKFNPQDIESMQILKDAAAASIYGARASNGVIILTTKQGKSGRINLTYDGYVGVQKIGTNQMPDLLTTSEYINYLDKVSPRGVVPGTQPYRHPVFGQVGQFSIPDYIIVSPTFKGGASASDPRANPDLYSIDDYSRIHQIMKTSQGTNWFEEISRPGLLTSHQLTASGGTDKSTYSVGMNYFNQQGTFKYTDFTRYTVRVNTSFKPKNFFRIGENMQISYEDRLGGANRGEGDAWAQSFRMVPYIPVNDIKGGWGGNGVGESGNGSNPVAGLQRTSDNTNNFVRLFGNVFAEVYFAKWLTGRTSFGLDYGSQYVKNFTKRTYERSENVSTAQLTEQSWYYTNWTWTNTLTFQHQFGENHDVKLLLGSEAIKNQSRGVNGFRERFDFETPDFVSLNTGQATILGNINNFNTGRNSLFSYFANLNYTFMNKYLLTAVFRRDGSSLFGPENRYANFPSVGVGWRVSEENFMKDVSWINDLKLRAGWGQMGSQSNVSSVNQFYTFVSSPSRTNYDINGGNTSAATGYRAGQEGNLKTKWETTETLNFGLDATVFNGKLDVTFDWYKKDTKDLLATQNRNGLEPLITKPFINIGTMRNTGFDLGLNHRGTFAKDFRYNVGINFSTYKNEMVKINNEGTPLIIGLERLGNALRTVAGQPISSFHGYVIDGFWNSDAEIAAGPTMTGAVVGSWRYKDISGPNGKPDGVINDADRTFLGNPHPDFQMGINVGLNWKNFDFTAFFFWNQGNEIYNYVKYYTDMRVFVGGVSKRVLYESWTPTKTNATLPGLGSGEPGSPNGFTSFTTSTSNSYYIEDGSYFRAKTLQLGYTLPKGLINRAGIENARIYIQAQNLFTITNYTGADPDLNIISREPFGRGDNYMGVDLSGFPNPKQFLFGLSVTF